jgi:hypothetical protein
MKDDQIVQFRTAWLDQLATLDPGRQQFAKSIAAIVDSSGADAAVKRDRLRLVCDIALEFYRHVLWQMAGVRGAAEPVLQTAVEQAARQIAENDLAISRCLERCLDAQEVAANVNATCGLNAC